jgi:tartrate-resistant acid phosphatase type 5
MDLPIGQPTRREFLVHGSAALALGADAPAQVFPAGGNPLEFMVIGDWGRDGAFHQRQVAAAMAQFQGSRFVVTTGDNFYQHGISSLNDPKWETSFQRIYEGVPQRWYAVLGNHDYGGRVEAQIAKTFHDDRWRMPDYWFDVRLDAFGRSDVHLFFINTVAWRGKEKFPYDWLGSSVSRRDQENHRRWLKDRLERSDAPIKFVFGHHPIYSVRTQGSYYGMDDLDGLLFDHGVTAYVNGHDHCMYHISAPDWRGRSSHRMHYICSGAGSQMRAVYPSCIPRGLASRTACVTKDQLGPRQPFWHAFFTKSDENPELDLKGGFALFQVQDKDIGIRFVEAVPDPSKGRLWRERYSATLPYPKVEKGARA